MTFRFMWGVGVNDPGPVRCLYPPVQAGDREWQPYFTVNMLNLPNHYHKGASGHSLVVFGFDTYTSWEWRISLAANW